MLLMLALCLATLNLSAAHKQDDMRVLHIIYPKRNIDDQYDLYTKLLGELTLGHADTVYILNCTDSLLPLRLSLQGRVERIVCVAPHDDAYMAIRTDIAKLRKARKLPKRQRFSVIKKTNAPDFMGADVVICMQDTIDNILRHQLMELRKGARVATKMRIPREHVFNHGDKPSASGFYIYKVKHPVSKDAQKKMPEGIMNDAYASMNGFAIPESERRVMHAVGAAPTYGEITYPSAAILFEDLKLKHQDVVYDLGSGIGKFVTQAHLATHAGKAIGIELSETRHNQAVAARDALKKRHKMHHRRVLEFRNEDILKSDWSDATVVYLCSTCFSDDLMRALMEKMLLCKPGLRVLTLRQLLPHDRFELVERYTLPMTWSSGSPVYLYRMK